MTNKTKGKGRVVIFTLGKGQLLPPLNLELMELSQITQRVIDSSGEIQLLMLPLALALALALALVVLIQMSLARNSLPPQEIRYQQ